MQLQHSIQGDIFRMSGFSISTLTFMFNNLTGYDLTDYILALNNFPQDENTDWAMTRLYQVQSLNQDDLMILCRSLLPRLNVMLQDHVKRWMVNTVNLETPIPPWIIATSEDPLPTHDDFLARLPKPKTIAEIETRLEDNPYDLVADMVKMTLPTDTGRHSTSPTSSSSSSTGVTGGKASEPSGSLSSSSSKPRPSNPRLEKHAVKYIDPNIILTLFEYQYVSSPDIFRILGPARPIDDGRIPNSLSENPCHRWGGCRSMLCTEWENADSDGEEYIGVDVWRVEWFTGECKHCQRTIPYKHYAIRMPMVQGGWYGCYCSFECLRNGVTYVDANLGFDEISVRTEDIDAMEREYQNYGIYDRTWPEINKIDVTDDDMLAMLPELPDVTLVSNLPPVSSSRSVRRAPTQTIISDSDIDDILSEFE